MTHAEIVQTITEAGLRVETIKIYYPKTERALEGWREVEPYSFSTDIGIEGEHLIPGREVIQPGHIFNGFTVASRDDHCDSFIIGKIKEARRTEKKFAPRNNWKVEF